MAVYLIDFENVTSSGISGVQNLTKDDRVYIFYTANASCISFSAHLNLLSSPAEISYYNVSNGGKNALDFQLASFLGYLISQGKEKQFFIISNDKGYEHVKSFWEQSGMAPGISINGSPSVKRTLALEKPFTSKIQQTEPDAIDICPPAADKEKLSPPKINQAKEKPTLTDTEIQLNEIFTRTNINDNDKRNKITALLKETKGKQDFYRGLIKLYGMDQGVEIYKKLRPEYSSLTKLI